MRAVYSFSLRVLALTLLSCAGQSVKPTSLPVMTQEQLSIVEPDLTGFRLRYVSEVTSTQAVTLVKASYEMVLDGKVRARDTQALGQALEPGGKGEFTLEAPLQFEAELDALSALGQRGESLLSAVRGTLFVKQGERMLEVPFARSREVRVPRFPRVKMQEVDAARYSDRESQTTFYLGVENPNPFPLSLKGLSYRVQIADKELDVGVQGAGETVAASSTGVFEVQLNVNEATFGPEVVQLIKKRTLPWVVSGELKGERYSLPYELKGDIQLRVSR